MACPFFQPQRQLDAGVWDPAPRLPLGAAWAGFCTASPAGAFEPPEATLREFCNCGYARGQCAYFPNATEIDSRSPDAIRFSVTAETPDATLVTYVLEKDHRPLAHGQFVAGNLREPGSVNLPLTAAPQLVSQARAFLQSHTGEQSPAVRKSLAAS